MVNRTGRRQSLVIISVTSILFFSSFLFAEPVDLYQAVRVTDTFLKTKTASPEKGHQPGMIAAQGVSVGVGPSPVGFREVRSDDGTLLAYVADLEPRGFVALSADTDIAPVIAYSFRSSFPSGADRRHPLYRMLREDMRLRMQALAEHPELRTAESGRLWDFCAGQQGRVSAAQAFQQWPPEGTTSTGGWLETAWEQEAPYNAFCPLDSVDGQRSYAGCGATALAQVLNFHRHCNVIFGQADSYMTYGGTKIDADSDLYDFPSFGDLNGYIRVVKDKYREGIALNDTDIAALNFACGVAMKMDYSSEGSGTVPTDMRDAIVEKFGFYSADMFGGLSRDSYLVLQENIINRLPALVTISPPDGFGGHAVVCDGYNTEGEYHLNFGWGSDYPEEVTEVWYRLPTDFHAHEFVITETILNIRPTEPLIEVEPASLSFYSAPGQESDAQTLHIENSVADVQVDSISSPDGFVIGASDDFSDHVASFAMPRPKQGASIRVKFLPERAGSYYGMLAIRYNNDNTRYVILRGWSFTEGTEVPPGSISGTWSQDKSPYLVTGDIQVRENSELMIEPGVKVFFMGPYGLTVGERARLMARGNAAQPIEFTAWNREDGWTGLRFIDSGNDDVLSCCSITLARKGAGLMPPSDDPAAGQETSENEEENDRGGAVYCYFSSPTIENCKLTNNTGDAGGAIYCYAGFPTISNTLIANNASLGGQSHCGGVCSDECGVVELRNCTIVNNSPGGVFAASWDGMTVTNTIVWGNEVYQIQTDESWPAVSFCDVQGGWAGEGNRNADPCFFEPSAGPGIEYDGSAANWALRSQSACINSGTPTEGLGAVDLAGGSRVYSDVIDIGAYENQSDLPLLTISPSATADAGCVPLHTNATIRLDIANTGKEDFKIESVSITGVHGIFSVVTPIADHVLAPGDSVPVEVAFRPARERRYTGDLDIRSTAANASHVQVALQGVGVTGTVVPAGSVSGTWKQSESPYIVTGDIYVPRARTLTIEPGVVVKFARRFRMTVGYRATLRAIGTEQDPIVFTATNRNEGWFGLRFINSGSEDVLQHCTIEYARKPYTGGGGLFDLFGGAVLCCGSRFDDPGFPLPSSPTIDSCLIARNHARTGGAIACLDDSEALITNNTIVDNTSDVDGAGIALYFAWCTVTNNVIARNSGLVGGGIMNYLGCPVIANNTIVHNRPSGLHLETTRMYPDQTETAPIINNIIWHNEIYLSDDVAPDEYEIQFNDIQGGWEGDGNINKDPLFADVENGDYHLKSQTGRWDPAAEAWVTDDVTSPCIDAGDPALDVGDEPEPHGGRLNLGAHGGTDQASKS